jgi:hypothetical protein
VRDRFVPFVLAFLAASCAASLPYGTDYPMSQTPVQSRDGLLRGTVPEGWYSATEDSLGTAVTLLLIRDPADAVISVRSLVPDALTAREIQRKGIELLAQISASARSGEPGESVSDLQKFQMGGTAYCGYEAVRDGLRERVVVFTVKGHCYECAVRGDAHWSDEQYRRAFTAQQAFLSSLAF